MEGDRDGETESARDASQWSKRCAMAKSCLTFLLRRDVLMSSSHILYFVPLKAGKDLKR